MNRREKILAKIKANVVIVHLGYMIEGLPSPCHVWTGSHSGEGRGGGYPRMSLDGQTVAVHLVVYTHHFGFIPGKKQIDHKCNNRLCVNEEHLQMVTHKRNQILRAKRAKEKTNAEALPDECLLPSDVTLFDALSRAGRPVHSTLHEARGIYPEAHFAYDFQRSPSSADVPTNPPHQTG